MMETYYDMLLTQKRPFNRTKGQIVTPLVTGVKPCQKMRQTVPNSRIGSTSPKASDRQIKTSLATGRSTSEVPNSILGSKTLNLTFLRTDLVNQVA